MREEAKEHPNKITISINGEDEQVIQEKKKDTATVTSVSDRASQGNIVTKNGRAGGSSEQAWSSRQALAVPILMGPMMKRWETLFRSRATTHLASRSE